MKLACQISENSPAVAINGRSILFNYGLNPIFAIEF
jgi:hypothetical protein